MQVKQNKLSLSSVETGGKHVRTEYGKIRTYFLDRTSLE